MPITGPGLPLGAAHGRNRRGGFQNADSRNAGLRFFLPSPPGR